MTVKSSSVARPGAGRTSGLVLADPGATTRQPRAGRTSCGSHWSAWSGNAWISTSGRPTPASRYRTERVARWTVFEVTASFQVGSHISPYAGRHTPTIMSHVTRLSCVLLMLVSLAGCTLKEERPSTIPPHPTSRLRRQTRSRRHPAWRRRCSKSGYQYSSIAPLDRARALHGLDDRRQDVRQLRRPRRAHIVSSDQCHSRLDRGRAADGRRREAAILDSRSAGLRRQPDPMRRRACSCSTSSSWEWSRKPDLRNT